MNDSQYKIEKLRLILISVGLLYVIILSQLSLDSFHFGYIPTP